MVDATLVCLALMPPMVTAATGSAALVETTGGFSANFHTTTIRSLESAAHTDRHSKEGSWEAMMGWYGGGSWGWVGWLVMALAMVAFWGLVVWGLVAIFRGNRDANAATGTSGRDPLEILDERFARGEIDVDEYHARQETLGRHH